MFKNNRYITCGVQARIPHDTQRLLWYLIDVLEIPEVDSFQFFTLTIEEGKQKITIDDKEYLLELPLHADVSLVKATKADTAGNLYFRMNSRATNSTIAYAADFVAAEVEEIVPVGQLLPEEIAIPAPVVDMVYERQGEKRFICPMWKKARARAEAKARERQERG